MVDARQRPAGVGCPGPRHRHRGRLFRRERPGAERSPDQALACVGAGSADAAEWITTWSPSGARPRSAAQVRFMWWPGPPRHWMPSGAGPGSSPTTGAGGGGGSQDGRRAVAGPAERPPRAGHERARKLKGARYALWKNPEDLSERPNAKLAWISRKNRWRTRLYVIDALTREGLATCLSVQRRGRQAGPGPVDSSLGAALPHPGIRGSCRSDWCRFNDVGSLFIDPGSPCRTSGSSRSTAGARCCETARRIDAACSRPRSYPRLSHRHNAKTRLRHGELTPAEFALKDWTTHQPARCADGGQRNPDCVRRVRCRSPGSTDHR